MKLRLWELEELDALLYMDADSEVLGNISAVFSLPTDFAAVLDANKKGYSCAPSPEWSLSNRGSASLVEWGFHNHDNFGDIGNDLPEKG